MPGASPPQDLGPQGRAPSGGEPSHRQRKPSLTERDKLPRDWNAVPTLWCGVSKRPEALLNGRTECPSKHRVGNSRRELGCVPDPRRADRAASDGSRSNRGAARGCPTGRDGPLEAVTPSGAGRSGPATRWSAGSQATLRRVPYALGMVAILLVSPLGATFGPALLHGPLVPPALRGTGGPGSLLPRGALGSSTGSGPVREDPDASGASPPPNSTTTAGTQLPANRSAASSTPPSRGGSTVDVPRRGNTTSAGVAAPAARAPSRALARARSTATTNGRTP